MTLWRPNRDTPGSTGSSSNVEWLAVMLATAIVATVAATASSRLAPLTHFPLRRFVVNPTTDVPD
jgi:hypothetical protein